MSIPSSTYVVEHLFLQESVFRIAEQIRENPDININIDTSYNIDWDKRKCLSSLILTLKSVFNETTELDVYIKMSARFLIKYADEQAQDSKAVINFANINAPAIIYPFVREHLATLTMKAGISPILLPPYNFVALAHNKQQ